MGSGFVPVHKKTSVSELSESIRQRALAVSLVGTRRNALSSLDKGIEITFAFTLQASAAGFKLALYAAVVSPVVCCRVFRCLYVGCPTVTMAVEG